MQLLRLCETCEYPPRLLEHWLHTIQKTKKRMELMLFEKDGKIQILTTNDLSPHLPGSRSEKTKEHKTKTKYFVKQTKGPLLPIKRHAQFEDRINKERIYPMDTLIQKMASTPNSFIKFSFKPISERKRRRALKKAKKPWFQAERLFDQWESKEWFYLSWRRLFGPIIRKAVTRLSHKTKKVLEQTESFHEREDPKRAVLDKLSRPLFQVEIELSHPFSDFINGFSIPYLGTLQISEKQSQLILSAEELASISSLPHPKNCANHLLTESTAYFPPPKENPLDLSENDRTRHLYLLGKTGMGKSTALLQIFKKDLEKDWSIILLDPHGDLIDTAIKHIAEKRQKDIILLDPSNFEYPLSLNPLELHPNDNPSLNASALVEMFEALARGSWGPRLEYILRNAILSLVLSPNTTLLDLPRLLTDKHYCEKIVQKIKDHELKRFWQSEFLNLDPRTRQEHIAPILNKVGPLLTSPLLRNIFGQPKGKFQFDQAFEKKKIVLIPLSKGKLGEDASRMLGMIFISMIQSALLRRAHLPPSKRPTVAINIDEFQNFSTPTLISMLSESRKYGLALTLANQYLTQLPPEIQDAVLGNVGSLISFRTSYQDAKVLAPTLNLTEEDLTNLSPFNCYAKLLKNSRTTPLFRWEVQKIQKVHHEQINKTKKLCQERYGRRRSLVEAKLLSRYTVHKSTHAK